MPNCSLTNSQVRINYVLPNVLSRRLLSGFCLLVFGLLLVGTSCNGALLFRYLICYIVLPLVSYIAGVDYNI